MLQVVNGQSANELWCEVASEFGESTAISHRPSRAGDVMDLGASALILKDSRQRWVVSRRPAMNPAFALAEVVWIMTGRRDAEFLNYFNRQLPRFAGDEEVYHGAYGYRLRSHFGFDQLNRAYSALRQSSESRQVVLQIWDGRIDLPQDNGRPSSEDIPCNVVSLLKIRGTSLDWTQIMRSTDVYLGLPHNFVQFTTLHEIVSGWLNLRLGTFTLFTDSLHLYLRDLDAIRPYGKDVLAHNADLLSMSKEESEQSFESIGCVVERIIDPSKNEGALLRALKAETLPEAYLNILRVLVAEGLRRRQNRTSAASVMASCTNPVYRQLWNNWDSRVVSHRVAAKGGE